MARETRKGRISEVENWMRPPLDPPRPPREVLTLVHELLHRGLERDADDHFEDERTLA